MNDAQIVLAERKADIEQMCQDQGVSTLRLFGSALRPSFNKDKSDVDFAIEFLDDDEAQNARRHQILLAGLCAIFQRPVHLVVLKTLQNHFLRQIIAQDGRLVYSAP